MLFIAALLAACGGGGTETRNTEPPAPEAETTGDEQPADASGDAAAGESLFNQNLIQASDGAAAGCVTCHYVNAEQGAFTGPNLASVATHAAERVEGQSAEVYLRNSIVNTNEYLVEGYAAGVMPATYGDLLSEEEVNNLVAYLLTLE